MFDSRAYIETMCTMVGPQGMFICSIVYDDLTSNRVKWILVDIVIPIQLHVC